MLSVCYIKNLSGSVFLYNVEILCQCIWKTTLGYNNWKPQTGSFSRSHPLPVVWIDMTLCYSETCQKDVVILCVIYFIVVIVVSTSTRIYFYLNT
jgi:hypothetical protein